MLISLAGDSSLQSGQLPTRVMQVWQISSWPHCKKHGALACMYGPIRACAVVRSTHNKRESHRYQDPSVAPLENKKDLIRPALSAQSIRARILALWAHAFLAPATLYKFHGWAHYARGWRLLAAVMAKLHVIIIVFTEARTSWLSAVVNDARVGYAG